MTDKRLEEIKARSRAMAQMTTKSIVELTIVEIAQLNVDNKQLIVEVDRLRTKLDEAPCHCKDCALCEETMRKTKEEAPC